MLPPRSCCHTYVCTPFFLGEQEAVKNTEYWRLIDPEGKPPGLLGWWPSKAVTFIDNHDTGTLCWHSIVCQTLFCAAPQLIARSLL